MKFSTLSAVAALMLAAALSACGGKAQFAVQGTITGLNNPGLVLANGADQLPVAAAATSFVMPKQIPYGTDYNVTVLANPAHQTCQPVNGSGSAGHTVAIAVNISCTQNTYPLGGPFIGLFNISEAVAATGTAAAVAAVPRVVVLLNGSTGGQVSVSSLDAKDTALGKGEFVFTSPVADGSAYGVTILSQPADINCTLANNVGVINGIAVSNMTLSCTPK
ncbi:MULTISPECIES: hypothetical protein [unclassified Duganella]|uniref:hypothetical protein n=1 Tax=unclassified Duganella TaxID=2636909 RepID=UPI000E354498|nr:MULTISPECIES: hypothetical protein [unclassified Duganella]RFP11268.1 hypothetical protein D0T23_20315 [Duganella sp. BJB475]RFP29587.1 hypothetical protein D0T21_17070 [Duganella sp. BJB476]